MAKRKQTDAGLPDLDAPEGGAPEIDTRDIERVAAVGLTNQDVTKLNQGDFLQALADAMQVEDGLARQLKIAKSAVTDLENEARRRLEAEGVDQFVGKGLVVKLANKDVANYDPEKWPDIVAALIKSGDLHVVQRRLTASAVRSMFDAGKPLPDGLKLDIIKEISVTRSRT